MKRSCCLAISLLTVVILIMGSLPIAGAQELSKSEQIQIDTMTAAFKIDADWAMGLMKNFAKTTPKLAAVAILELAKTSPEVATMVATELAKTSPEVAEVAIRGLLAITTTSIDLAKTELGTRQALELRTMVIKAVVQMAKETPQVAAIAMVSLFQVSPEIGVAVREKIVAAGVKEEYLKAATPITP